MGEKPRSMQSMLGSNAALVSSALPLGFMGFKILQGDTDLSVSPHLGFNVDPSSGKIKPSVQANFQFGQGGPLNPSLNLGGELGSSGGIPVSPTLGSGFNTGDARGASRQQTWGQTWLLEVRAPNPSSEQALALELSV